jgi:hypothetical protein
MAELPADFVDRLRSLDRNATAAPFYRLDPPWLAGGSETSILAGSPDPHVATFVCDFDFFAFSEEDEKTSECPDADADLLIYLRNHAADIADEIADLRAQAERLVSTIEIHHRNFDEMYERAKAEPGEFAAWIVGMTHPEAAQR